MKYALIYAVAIGLVVAGVDAGYIPDELAGALYVAFAMAGIGLIALAIRSGKEG